ncbi:MAG: endopeptidase La [Lentisphaerae bacterium]|nr:endopeptidase La [Lentisphaerota bacterium]
MNDDYGNIVLADENITELSDNGDKNAEKQKPGNYVVSLLPLKDVIIFPYTLSPLVIEGEPVIKMLETLVAGERIIAVFPEVPVPKAKPIELTAPAISTFDIDGRSLCTMGVLSRIVKMLKFPDGTVRILVRGLKRIKFVKKIAEVPPFTVEVQDVIEDKRSNIETTAMVRNAVKQFQEIISTSPFYPEELRVAILNIDDSRRLADLMADTLHISFMEKLNILAIPDLHARLQLLTILLNRELEVLHVGTKIQSQVSSALGKSQREYFLREQLRTIKKELGEENKNPDIIGIEEKLSKLKLPEKVEATIKKEMERLVMIPQASPEYNVAYTYVDWLINLPWNIYTEDRIDIKESSGILDSDHYDLKDVKERILDFLAVLQLKKDRKSPILCFVGPPGVGKTSLGQSIAKAMNRKFVRMSLGGIKDEAEIRGHRRTYVGALPGRIIQGLKRAQSSNPLFMLDEIDKIGNDFRGDPASALLEVLDPQQNSAFNDHYVEIDFDLSSVMFIATANITDTIPHALLDRMEILRLPGYTIMEKKQIASRFLVPKQLKENGLEAKQVKLSAPAVEAIISRYTREAGVRNLERSIGTVFRKIARKIVEKEIPAENETLVKPEDLGKFLGPQKFFMDEIEKKDVIGTATGMAWTSAGGSVLAVDVTSMPGKGSLKLTGSLGDIMKESAEAAFSFIKSHHEALEIDSKVFEKTDFHIHIPDGATPKDGPSAGITIATALISLLTNRPAKSRTAMTGEITLRGKITPVGGIKEKVIAALVSGISTIVMPDKNEKDLENIPDEVRKKVKFIFVSDIMESLHHTLGIRIRKKKDNK